MAGPSTFVMKRRRSCSCSASAAPVVALYPASGRPSGTYVGKQGPFGRGHLCSSSRLIGRGGPKPGAAWGLNLPPRVLRELPGGGSGRRERRPAFQHGRGTVVRSADERTKLRALPKNPASALLSCVPAMCLHGRTRQNRCLAASGWLATASRCDQSRGARPLLTGVESSLEPSDAGRCGQLRPSTTTASLPRCGQFDQCGCAAATAGRPRPRASRALGWQCLPCAETTGRNRWSWSA